MLSFRANVGNGLRSAVRTQGPQTTQEGLPFGMLLAGEKRIGQRFRVPMPKHDL